MNREQIKKWLPEITAYSEGKNIWQYDGEVWVLREHPAFILRKEYVIEDKHFKARKAHALGEPIEFIDNSGIPQTVDSNIAWSQDVVYRPKKKEWYEDIPKEGILCWVWDNINEKQVEIVKWKRPQDFMTIHGLEWKYAEPIKPEECWKETK